jgi:hypothetical protein
MFNPKHSHEIAIKWIDHYLIGTKDRGMIIKPTATIGIDAYPAMRTKMTPYAFQVAQEMSLQLKDVLSTGLLNFRLRQLLLL